MPPIRHLLYLRRHPLDAGRGLRWARRVARAMEATLSVRGDGGGAWDPATTPGGPWDLVLKVAEPRRGPLPWRIHPRDRALLSRSSVPVWLLHPAQDGTVSSVVAAVGIRGPTDTPGDRRVLRTAALLARRLEASLTVVRPWSLLGDSILASPLRGVSRERYRRLLSAAQAEHEAGLAGTLAAEIPGTSVNPVVRKGPPELVIRHAGWRHDADVLVMGGMESPGLGARLLGPLPERLFRGIPCSLFLAGPPVAPSAPPGPAGGVASLPRTGTV